MLSDFIDDDMMTVTQKAYVGVPLSTLSNRGEVLERVVRRFLEHSTEESTTDPVAGTNISGKKRGRNSAPYDFLVGDQRVEVKTAQLTWDTFTNYWYASWRSVKVNEHDALYLALYTPSGVYIFKHDGKFGVSKDGRTQSTLGGKIKAYGPYRESSISKATEAVLEKMRPMLVICLKYE
jgi:hypothetical protein